MTLKLHELSPSDPVDQNLIPAIARVHLTAWLSNSLYEAIYYGPPSSHARIIENNRRRHSKTLTSEPSSRYAVVLDDGACGDNPKRHSEQTGPDPNHLIAWAKYDIFERPEAEEERQDTGEIKYPPYTNLPLANHFWDLIVQSRQRVGKSLGAHVSVDQLATDPDHHRRGAGRMLMEHIVKKADELGLPATLEASPQGMNLYTSVGFEPVDEFWVDLLRFEGGEDKGEAWSKEQHRVPGQGPGWYKQVAMIRQPRKTE
ncbi:hypothetical protein EDD37DRAFT_485441 [Exophiala viscosa]|uniref:uncharacterized protein n=1 Tax=Exophiala viscosa TaxID=2486360 RepID=UPI0021906029|nr:hypothetical protein EDD37DRAFT_485441 [Exophiala viscosa]